MREKKRYLFLFVVSLLLSFVFWRLWVLLLLGQDRVGLLRGATGLTFHHYHYGLVLILFAALFLIFFRKNSFSVVLMGLGLGSVFDSFVSRLVKSGTRYEEIFNYHIVFWDTVLLFIVIILLAGFIYRLSEKYKKIN